MISLSYLHISYFLHIAVHQVPAEIPEQKLLELRKILSVLF